MKKKQHAEQSEEEVVLDFDRVKKFCTSFYKDKKWKKWQNAKYFHVALLLLLMLIPLWVGVSARIQTAYLPITDDWAVDSVHRFYRDQLRQSIATQYPTLPAQNRDALVDKQFGQVLAEQRDVIDQQIQQTSAQFRSHFQDDNGYTWMPDIDPYNFIRLAQNQIDHGYTADYVNEEGQPVDGLMLAPLGGVGGYKTDPHGWTLAQVARFVRIFEPEATVMYGASFFPVFGIIFGTVAVFLLAYLLSGYLGGVVAGLIYVTNFAILNRTFWGHADTDTYNVVFPIAIALFVFLAMREERTNFAYLYTVVAGLLMGLFSFAWSGWWFMFDFILFSFIALGIYLAINKNWKKLKEEGIRAGLFFVISLVLVYLSRGWGGVSNIFGNLVSFTQIKAVGTGARIWPNVLTTVAELNEVNLGGMLGNLTTGFSYPVLFLFLGFLGLAFIFLKDNMRTTTFGFAFAWYVILVYMRTSFKDTKMFAVLLALPLLLIGLYHLYMQFMNKDKKFELSASGVFTAVLFALWIVGSMYASTKGIRFIMLLVPALAITFGVALDRLMSLSSNYLKKSFSIPPVLTIVAFVVATFFLLQPSIDMAHAMGKQDVPSVNDAWANALFKIRDNSQEDAIITSWWDFGHWFKYFADRPVTFDGASQDTPRAHWVGKLLLTGNEREAIGILRMLNCGGERAAMYLDEHYNDLAYTVDTLNEVLVSDEEGAREVLNEAGVSEDITNRVIANTHCQPPEGFVIASADMVGKAGVWGHFGSWNFDRALQVNIVSNSNGISDATSKLMERFGFEEQRAQDLYWEIKGADPNQWIAPWPGYVTGKQNCETTTEKVVCRNNLGGASLELEVNLITQSAQINVPGGPGVAPRTLGFVTTNGIETYDVENTSFPYGVLLIPEPNGQFSHIYMAPELVDSVFTRMYYIRGHGLEYFKHFDYQASLTGVDIHTYNVVWEGGEMTQLFAVEEVDEEEGEDDEE